MALLYPQADLTPTKLELLAAWLPTRSWYRGAAAPEVTRVAGFRFDDPDGEVGVETLLVRADDGALLQVPLTYRAAPLGGGDEWFVGNSQHSVLGQRWIYDGCGDPVYANALAAAILAGGTQADEFIETDGQVSLREPSVLVTGSGTRAEVPRVGVTRIDDGDAARIVTDMAELVILRTPHDAVGSPRDAATSNTLTATWDGQATPLLLAYAKV